MNRLNNTLWITALGALALAGCADAPQGGSAGVGSSMTPLGSADGRKGGDERTGHYDVVPNWWKTAPNHDAQWQWGVIGGVAVDTPDRIIAVTRGDRPAGQPGRAGTSRPTNFIVVADGNGNIVEQWTQWDSILTLPHQVYINPYDPDRHVWVIDSGGGEGWMQVLKFSNDGQELVMRLGNRDHPKTREESRTRMDWDPFTYGWPSVMAFLPDGSFYLADGYWNSRILKYTAEGEFLFQWGTLGTGPGEFDLLHGLALDRDRRVYVADRQNSRIQVFTETGDFIEEWRDIFDPVGIWIDEDQWVWVLDASLNRVLKYSRDGVLQYHWGTFGQAGAIGRGTWEGGLSLPHQMDMDENGTLYLASYNGGWVNKFVPKPNADPNRILGPRLRLDR
jgi:peptidylamidoglycolate lyase